MHSTLNPAELAPAKKHYEILDGLRGLAAIAIVVFHFMEMAIADFSQNFIAHGYLAVDFFFCLSGFVVAYAYDDRIQQMGLATFFKARLIRLHPLVILGSVFGLLGLLFDPFAALPEGYGLGQLLMIFMSSILMIPYPVMEERAFNLFTLNAPAWSLFFEYAINIIYALFLYKVRNRLLSVLVLLSAGVLCWMLAASEVPMGGWAGSNFWEGIVRITFSFLAGMLIFRSNWIIKNKLGFAGLAILLLLAFIVPYGEWNWLTQPFIVIIYFPLLISLGAGAVLSPGLKKICNFSGQISYPLYMTHYAFLWMFLNYCIAYKPEPGQLAIIIGISTLLLIGLAWLVMVFYDIPLRQYLSRRTKKP